MAFRFDRFVDKFAAGTMTAEDMHDALHAAALWVARGLPAGSVMQGTDGRHWRYTGEHRPPHAGEWFYDGEAISQAKGNRRVPYTIWIEFDPRAEHRQQQQQQAPPPRPQNTRAAALAELGLPNHATAKEIRARYLALMKQHHPDRNPGDAAAAARAKAVSAAYSRLK